MRISDWSSDVCSSDLCQWAGFDWDRELGDTLPLSRYTLTAPDAGKWRRHAALIEPRLAALQPLVERARNAADRRSEEHTSELQSLMRISYAVFCSKKKMNTYTITTENNSKRH